MNNYFRKGNVVELATHYPFLYVHFVRTKEYQKTRKERCSMKVTKAQAREVACKIFGHNKAELKEDGESFYTFSCGLLTVLIEKYYGELSGDRHPNGCISIDTISAPFSVVNGEIDISWSIDEILPKARHIAMSLVDAVNEDGNINDKSELKKVRAAALEFYDRY